MSEHSAVQDVYMRACHVLRTLSDVSTVTNFPVSIWTAYSLGRDLGEGGLPLWDELPRHAHRILQIAHLVDVLDEQEFERQKQLAGDLDKQAMEQLHLLFKNDTAENLLKSLGWKDTDLSKRLRDEAMRLKLEIATAINTTSRPNLIEPDAPAPDAIQEALNDWFNALAVHFLAKANEEPIRVVASLLVRMIGHRAISVEFIGDLPMVGSVSADQQQIIHCLGVSPDHVCLVEFNGEAIVGERIESEEIRLLFQEIGLPVWRDLGGEK